MIRLFLPSNIFLSPKILKNIEISITPKGKLMRGEEKVNCCERDWYYTWNIKTKGNGTEANLMENTLKGQKTFMI